MKRAATLLLAVTLILPMVSCSDGPEDTNQFSDNRACSQPTGNDGSAQLGPRDNSGREALIAADANVEESSVLQNWVELERTRDEHEKLHDALSGLERHMETKRGERAAREVATFASAAGCAMLDEAEEDFRRVFDASDWQQWEGEEHAKMFRAGLMLSARHSMDRQPDKAVETWELFLDKFPNDARANDIRYSWLPTALSAACKPDDAIKRLRQLRNEADEEYRPQLMMLIGDVFAIEGEFASSRDAYRFTLRLITSAGRLEQPDQRHATRREANMRLALIGKEAPDITTGRWFGANARRLSGLCGKVIVLDYWATW